MQDRDYSGDYVQDHCPDCGESESESECVCGETAVQRVRIKVRGEASAQGIFDVMNGRNVRWIPPTTRKGEHWIEFDDENVISAREHIRTMFPLMRFSAVAV
jgi:hypothetical protein